MSPESATVRLRAMATDVTLSVVAPAEIAAGPLERARNVFTRVEAACTRFDPASPLMRANASPSEWHVVPPECFAAIAEAARAHQETGGLFDPRVLESLLRLGYDRTLAFHRSVELATSAGRNGSTPAPGRTPVPGAQPWRPGMDPDTNAVRLGARPIDLGGIGKGLAVRWAAAELAGTGAPFLVEAGGDISVGGRGPDGEGWLVGVEDPAPGQGRRPSLVAVLCLADAACATSSVRVRAWTVDGRPVHHVIDPRTGESSESGLRAVTVVGPDPAWAEVWSKTLLLVGSDGVADACRARCLPALWVDADGVVGLSDAMRAHVIWEDQREQV